MENGKVRHMFPGGNTSKGFYSYYDYILPQQAAESIFIIKGGPGTGKSTFMKYIANKLLKNGYDIELMHCSSDPDSLDGIVAPALKIAMLDGTTPHAVETKNPGAVDEIINLGEYWDESGIKSRRDEVLILNAEKGDLFKRAYRYLAAAASVYSDNVEIYKKAVDLQTIYRKAGHIINSHFEGEAVSEYGGALRKLFATAITPLGLRSYLTSILNTERLVLLKGEAGTGTEVLLEKVKDHALMCGYYVEAFYCALNPEKLEHIVIPEKNLSIATCNNYHTIVSGENEVIDTNEFYDPDIVGERKDIIEYNRLEYEGLLNRTVMTLEQAKRVHSQLETTYAPHMDFAGIDALRARILERIMR